MDEQKKREQQAKLDAMYAEEFLALERKGATADLLREPVFQDLLTDLVLTNHAKELGVGTDIRWMLAEEFIETASPGSLREFAAIFREDGDFDTAYDLEVLADQRERGPDV